MLSISHRTDGFNMFSDGSHPNHFSAMLINADVDGRSRVTQPFSARSIDQEEISRFSQKRLVAFAERALQKLRDLHAAQDPAVLRYFEHDDTQASIA